MNDIPSPRDFGVPHDEFRPNQYEMYKTASDAHAEDGGIFFAELAVGSGKSTVSAALGHDDKVLALSHTLPLLDQYRDKYNFVEIKGRQEYPCALELKVEVWKNKYGKVPTAHDCHMDKMFKCPAAGDCSYLIQKVAADRAQRTCCTYRYAAMSYMMKDREGILCLDEAHSAVEELIAFNTFTVTPKMITYYSLNPFPFTEYGENNEGATLTDEDTGKITSWLYKSAKNIDERILESDISESASRMVKMRDKLDHMGERLVQCDWFLIFEDDKAVMKALTADHIMNGIMANKKTTLAMSGTIGDPAPLAKEMGIEEYQSFAFPHPIPVDKRPVIDLKMGRMTYNNLQKNPGMYKAQAMLIYGWLQSIDPTWRGLILTSSYKKIGILAEHLVSKFSNRRFIVQGRGMTPSELTHKFITDVQPGDVAIATLQGLGTGVDLYGHLGRFVVIAGVSHPSPTDKYAMARREVSGGQRYQLWHTYSQVAQASGRTTRGAIDEDTGELMLNMTVIADGCITVPRAMKFYPKWFVESIV